MFLVRLHARGFARHTFLCGQSGSGKTFSLGVLLEGLLLETSLRVIVLDPNPRLRAVARTARRAPRAIRVPRAFARCRACARRAARERRSWLGPAVCAPATWRPRPRRRPSPSTRSPTARSTRPRDAVDALRAGTASFDDLREHLPLELQLRLDNLGSRSAENLILMRMGSRADLAHVQDVFSMVPAGLLAEATAFGLGECLLAGRIVDDPTLARTSGRLSREGGADVPATWAQRPSAG
jgi:Helicase HerA, central domain